MRATAHPAQWAETCSLPRSLNALPAAGHTDHGRMGALPSGELKVGDAGHIVHPSLAAAPSLLETVSSPSTGCQSPPPGLSYPTAFFLLTFHMKVHLFHDPPSPLVSQTKPVEVKPEERGADVEYALTLTVQGPHTLSQHSHLFLSYPCPAHTQFPATQCASSAPLSPHVCVYSLP